MSAQTVSPLNYRKMLLGLLFVSAAFLVLVWRSHHQLQRFEENSVRIGTLVQLVVVLPDQAASSTQAQQLFQMAYNEIDRLDRVFSRYRQDSEVAAINRHPQDIHTISLDLSTVVQRAWTIYQDSQNVFDITLLPLIELWQSCAKTDLVPSDRELNDVLAVIGMNKLSYDANQQQLQLQPGMKLDLGGIAKGYVIDRIHQIWEEAGVKNGLINIGGDVWAIGRNQHQRPWRMGIQDPDHQEQLLQVIELTNQGMVTSGDYQRYVEIGGHKYSHIIDPRSGWPVEGARSVTVIGDDMMGIDAWATALSVLGAPLTASFVPKFIKAQVIYVYENADGDARVLNVS